MSDVMRWALLGCCLGAVFAAWPAESSGRVVPARQVGFTVPGWNSDGFLFVPVRGLVEALGGMVAADVPHHALTVTLDGLEHRYYFDSDAQGINSAVFGCSRQGDITYYPVTWLASDFHLMVRKNAQGTPVVLSDNVSARTVLIASRPLRTPGAECAGTHALLHIFPGHFAFLIGGTAGGRFLSDEQERTRMLRHARYAVYSLRGRLGFSRAKMQGQVNYGTDLRVTFASRGEAYALGARWNALPRRLHRDDPHKPIYRQMARRVLDAHELTGVSPRVTEAFTCDLNGDGQQERLISATTAVTKPADARFYEQPIAGDYSFVAIEGYGYTRVLAGNFMRKTPAPQEGIMLSNYFVAAALDIDGDGKLEVLVGNSGYESEGDEAYRVTPAGIDYLFGGGEGE